MALDPTFDLTAEDIARLDDKHLDELRDVVDRLRQLVAAEKRRRRDEARSKYDVLGRDTTATCLRHRRLVRWMAAPVWWYHADFDFGPAEYRQCSDMLEAPAPLVFVDSEGKTLRGTGYLPPMVKLANRLAAAP